MSYVWVEGLVIEHLEQTSLRPCLHCNKLLEFVQYSLGVDDSGHLRTFTDPSAATITLRLLVGDLYRLGDLQISKIKRPANQTLSLSKFAQLCSGTMDFLSGFLSWDARYLQWCNLLPNGGRVWAIYRWRSQG